MRVALLTTFKASKKEPLGEVLERIRAAFDDAGLGMPELEFTLADEPVGVFTSSVDRVLKRYPDWKRFLTSEALAPGVAGARRLTNKALPPAVGEQVEFATIAAIAAGVPRSFPFHNFQVHLRSPVFGEGLPSLGPMGSIRPGVMLGDSWWVNGRVRSLMALAVVEGEASNKKLPALPDAVAKVYAACGKVKSTAQMPFIEAATAEAAAVSSSSEAARAIMAKYRGRLAEVMERARMPHDLPSVREAVERTSLAEISGPRKPALVEAFRPLGYSCKGESGVFTLRRRTAGNLTVEINLDVGTWSRNLTGHFEVHGLGFRAVLPMPVSPRSIDALQYPIGSAERWKQIVENLAALAAARGVGSCGRSNSRMVSSGERGLSYEADSN